MEHLDECVLPDTATLLQHLWGVMGTKEAAHQIPRQLTLLEAILSTSGGNVKLSDLRLLTRVLTHLYKEETRVRAYSQPLQDVLHLLKRPPTMDKVSDELNYVYNLVELFNALGYFLLDSKSEDRQTQVLEIILNIMFCERTPNCNTVPVKACVEAMEASEFTGSLADFMAIVEDNLYHFTIFTALQICLASELLCWAMLSKGVVETLLVRLTTARDEDRSGVLDLTYRTLWRLFSCTDHREDWRKVAAPSTLALRGLRYVLREEALVHSVPGRSGNSLANVAALTLKMLHLFPDAEWVASGLIEDITFFATMTEAVLEIHILPFFKSQDDHLQFKKLMLACLSLSPISSKTLDIFQMYNLPKCLQVMLGGSASNFNGSAITWTPEHAVELFRCALYVVCALYDSLSRQFIRVGLMKRLITFLRTHYVVENNRPDDLAHTVLKLVMSFSCRRPPDPATLDALREAGAPQVLLQLCAVLSEASCSLTLRNQAVLYLSLCVLTCLMENNADLQKQHAEESFALVSTLYQRILKPLVTDSVLNNKLTVAASNFAWEVLVWNKDNAPRFISSGGIFSHIDILERSPCSVQLVYLSMLADLCEYPQSVPYLVSWRGPGGVKLLSVLCRIWRAEEERLRVPRGDGLCVSDIERPLMGEDQYQLARVETGRVVSICDVYGSVRPKVFGVVQLLHRHQQVVQLCEEHYRLGHDRVPLQDQVTLQLVEAYLPLKMGEVWWEIRNKQEGVLPLDRYLAETLADRYLNWSLRVQRAQHELLLQQETLQRGEEQQIYREARTSKLTTALEALREVVAIARTADRHWLLEYRRTLQKTIESSRPKELQVPSFKDLGITMGVINSKSDVVMQSDPSI